jgi:hypothetical protein
VWKHPESPAKKKFKTTLLVGKVMIAVFGDVVVPIYFNYMECKKPSITSIIPVS